MMEVREIDVRSSFKIGFIFYTIIMVLVGVIGLLFLLYNLITNFSLANLGAAGGAILIYLLMSLVYGLIAALFFGLAGFVYNKIAARFGGVRIELEKLD